jgi:hypothetical protein
MNSNANLSSAQQIPVELGKLKSLNDNLLESWHKLSKFLKDSSTISFPILTTVTFTKDCLSMVLKNEQLVLTPLQTFFKDVTNLFQDKLPDTEYFDLKDVIKKYEQSHDLKTVTSWKSALKQMYFYFQALEKQITEGLSKLEQVKKMFTIPEDCYVVKFTSKNKIKELSLSFSIDCNTEFHRLVEWQQILIRYYTPAYLNSKGTEIGLKSASTLKFAKNNENQLTIPKLLTWKTYILNEQWTDGVHSFTMKIDKFETDATNNWGLIIGFAYPNFSRTDAINGANGMGYIAKTGNKTPPPNEMHSKQFSDASKQGDQITCTVDFKAKTVSISKNGKDLGVAFTDIKGPLLPAVSVAGSEVIVTIV